MLCKNIQLKDWLEGCKMRSFYQQSMKHLLNGGCLRDDRRIIVLSMDDNSAVCLCAIQKKRLCKNMAVVLTKTG